MDTSAQPTPFLSDGRYEIIAALGEGGMAYVFKAFDTRLKVERAIKILAPRLLMHRQIRERFEVEASTMAQLHHKHIVTVHDIGNEQNLVYMVMEMLPGGSLKDRIDDHGVLHPQQAVDAAIAMASGLGYAHENNVIHRDVKLDNVLISSKGVLKVADFGIARIDDGNTGMTQTGAVMGTLAYMAPEQRLSARRAGPQADLYAVAASFYVMISNRNPIELYSEDMQEEAFADLSEPVVEFLKRGCHFNPSMRFNDSEDLIAALENLRSDLPPLPDDAVPMFLPRVNVSPTPSENDVTTLHTMWNTLIDEDSTGTFTRPQATQQQATQNTLMDIDLMGDTEAAFPQDAVTDETGAHALQNQPTQVQSHKAPAHQTTPSVSELPDAPKKGNGMLLAVIALLVLAGGGFFLSQNQEPQATQAQLQAQAEEIGKLKAQEEARKRAEAEKQKAEEEAKKKAEEEAKKKAEEEAKQKAEQAAKKKAKKPRRTTSKPKEQKKPAAESPSVPKTKGKFVINSRPWSKVTINGKTQNTPFKGELPVGRYSVTLRDKDGRKHTTKITISEGNKPKVLCWNFDTESPC